MYDCIPFDEFLSSDVTSGISVEKYSFFSQSMKIKGNHNA